MICAPSASSSKARSTAASGPINEPPSEKLSGVAFTIPISQGDCDIASGVSSAGESKTVRPRMSHSTEGSGAGVSILEELLLDSNDRFSGTWKLFEQGRMPPRLFRSRMGLPGKWSFFPFSFDNHAGAAYSTYSTGPDGRVCAVVTVELAYH